MVNPLDPFFGALTPEEAFKRRLDDFFNGLSPNKQTIQQAQSKPKLVGLSKGRRTTSASTRTFSGSPRRELTSIMSNVEDGREVVINRPTSYRFYDLTPRGQKYHETNTGDKPGVGMNEYSGSHREAIASTCVRSIKYQLNVNKPQDSKCWIQFTTGTKWYVFRVPPEALEDFLDATSKGRHTNRVLKTRYRAPTSWYM